MGGKRERWSPVTVQVSLACVFLYQGWGWFCGMRGWV